MKAIFASDLHGSYFYVKELLKQIEIENPDKVILLGDLYYHGPRNPLTEEYSPKDVAELLNSIKDKLVVVKGNCDSEVDQMISEFEIKEDHTIMINDKKVFLTHGHVYNIERFPFEDFDILAYGHIHIGFIEKAHDKIIMNPGSLSLPKANSTNSFIVIDEEAITLKDIEGNTISRYIL